MSTALALLFEHFLNRCKIQCNLLRAQSLFHFCCFDLLKLTCSLKPVTMQFKLSLVPLLLIATLVTTCLADKMQENASESLKDDDDESVDSKVCVASFLGVFLILFSPLGTGQRLAEQKARNICSRPCQLQDDSLYQWPWWQV